MVGILYGDARQHSPRVVFNPRNAIDELASDLTKHSRLTTPVYMRFTFIPADTSSFEPTYTPYAKIRHGRGYTSCSRGLVLVNNTLNMGTTVVTSCHHASVTKIRYCFFTSHVDISVLVSLVSCQAV
jgi:hypothetical protein